VFNRILEAQQTVHRLLARPQQAVAAKPPALPGLDLRPGVSFSVGNLRPARRIGSQGELRTEMVVEVVQTYRPPAGTPFAGAVYRGGATLIVDLRSWAVRYCIYKRLWDQLPDDSSPGVLAHRFGQSLVQPVAGAPSAAWNGEAESSLSGWLAATYDCQERLAARRKRASQNEPFALLHRTEL
jgi:hypothetical protein